MKLKKISLVIILILCAQQLVSAKSKTGLASSLIVKWQPGYDTTICPSFRYPSHPPSLLTGEKVFKQNCASCHSISNTSKHLIWLQIR